MVGMTSLRVASGDDLSKKQWLWWHRCGVCISIQCLSQGESKKVALWQGIRVLTYLVGERHLYDMG